MVYERALRSCYEQVLGRSSSASSALRDGRPGRTAITDRRPPPPPGDVYHRAATRHTRVRRTVMDQTGSSGAAIHIQQQPVLVIRERNQGKLIVGESGVKRTT